MKKLLLAALCVLSLQGMESQRKGTNYKVTLIDTIKVEKTKEQLEELSRKKALKESEKIDEERKRLLKEAERLKEALPLLSVTVLNGTAKKLLWRFGSTKDGLIRERNGEIKPWASTRIPVESLKDYFRLEVFNENVRHYSLKNILKTETYEWSDSYIVEENDWKEWVEKNEVKVQLIPATKEVGQKDNEHERRLLVSLSR